MAELDLKVLGQNIKKYRALAPMTQDQLAQEIGVTVQYISVLENGRANRPSHDVVFSIANALGVTTSQLDGFQISNTDDFYQFEVQRLMKDYTTEQRRTAHYLSLQLIEAVGDMDKFSKQ